ncbi:unnamed protein product [Litomosoides sigmodontis]|uniref:Uncharacterized protein n=1 Tax=Litomosoides sigmodontis TaxID=42156 RepID=A0A3P6ULU1_LITSI|nr:unnamed protein product [Litomosoides sigmodontis]
MYANENEACCNDGYGHKLWFSACLRLKSVMASLSDLTGTDRPPEFRVLLFFSEIGNFRDSDVYGSSKLQSAQ